MSAYKYSIDSAVAPTSTLPLLPHLSRRMIGGDKDHHRMAPGLAEELRTRSQKRIISLLRRWKNRT
ncbi:hypothetical protein E4U36_002537 [Claviceps purpurea]|nr:hypothetical protein E4U36_002537 [Claviceps purpurea]